MKAEDAPNEDGYILTKIGSQYGRIFLTEDGRNTKNSGKAKWFKTLESAENFAKKSLGDWTTISW